MKTEHKNKKGITAKKSFAERNARYIKWAGYILVIISILGALKWGLNSWLLVIYILGAFMLVISLYFRIKNLKEQVELARKKKQK